jgi:hypothetical protein
VRTTDFVFGAAAGAGGVRPSKAIAAGARAFDYDGSWNTREGNRIVVNLDGIWPFNLKNGTLESVDKSKEPVLYLPPDTTLEIRLHVHRTKMEATFHPGIQNFDEYFDPEQDLAPVAPLALRMWLQDVSLEYESVELLPQQEVIAKNAFIRGLTATYPYDIARGQHSSLAPGLSFTENTFQVMPYCRLAYLLFLTDWAVQPSENYLRPISALSRFPENCSQMIINYAGDDKIVTRAFSHFGNPEITNDLSKKIYYDYLKKNRMTADSFDDWFPRGNAATGRSLIQAMVLDLRSAISKKTENLTVKMFFGAGAGNVSPQHVQLALVTVHPIGKAVCSSPDGDRFVWEFRQTP